MQIEEDYRGYKELAVAIVRVAAADYVEALIIQERGGALTKAQKKRIFKKIVEYGRRRYVYKLGGIVFRQEESHNLVRLNSLRHELNFHTHTYRAQQEITADEQFFRSGLFSACMPNTDPELFIKMLRVKADARELIRSGYDSFMKHRAANYDD